MNNRIFQFFDAGCCDCANLPAQRTERTDNAFHTCHASFAQIFIGIQRNVQRATAKIPHQIRTSCAFYHSGGTIHINARRWRIVWRKCFTRAAPIRAGAQVAAQCRIVFKCANTSRQHQFILFEPPCKAGIFKILEHTR